jgi:diguanylate cyclase (GGDEF)-like protein
MVLGQVAAATGAVVGVVGVVACVALLGVAALRFRAEARSPWARAWRLTVLGAALRAAGMAWSHWRGDAWPSVVVLGGAVVAVAGLVAALRDRTSHGRAVDMALEIVVAAGAVGFTAITVRLGDVPHAFHTALFLGVPLFDLTLLWLLVRVHEVAEESRMALRWASTAAIMLIVADGVPALRALPVALDGPWTGLQATAIVGLLVWGGAVLHPSLDDPGPAPPVTSTGLRAGDLVAILAPVVLGPLTAMWEASMGAGRPWAVVVGGLVLPLLVVLLLVRQVRLRARREYLAHHDPLTGLVNQRLFHDRVELELARGRRDGTGFAVMFLDLDGFKDVNDSLGHDAGDDLLRGVACRLSETIREGDTVARVGGDEFTILAPGAADPAEARRIATEVQEVFRTPIHADGRMLFTGVSIGVAVAPADGTTADELVKHADTAMYRAKTAGLGRVQLYTSEMNSRARLRLALENELRRAIDREQLALYYQPKVRADDRVVVGHEALVRWHHPELGLVSPSAFVPLAETKGMIVPIGRWVLVEACRQARRWVDQGRWSGPVAVNVSALELRETPLDVLVEEALAETGLHPRLLEVELTESALLRDLDSTAEAIARVRARGTIVSLDDFGTGYSGLSYLAQIPLDRLKIDRSFVETIRPGTEASPVVEAILALARGLGLEVVAEGVETTYQAEWLRRRGCDTLQGFLFGAPAPVGGSEALPIPVGDAQRVHRALMAVCNDLEMADPTDLDAALLAFGAADASSEGEATLRAARRLTLAAALRANAAPTP